MKRPTIKSQKLTLGKQTIRELQTRDLTMNDLAQVAGGRFVISRSSACCA